MKRRTDNSGWVLILLVVMLVALSLGAGFVVYEVADRVAVTLEGVPR